MRKKISDRWILSLKKIYIYPVPIFTLCTHVVCRKKALIVYKHDKMLPQELNKF